MIGGIAMFCEKCGSKLPENAKFCFYGLLPAG
jgi:hypothetical protein